MKKFSIFLCGCLLFVFPFIVRAQTADSVDDLPPPQIMPKAESSTPAQAENQAPMQEPKQQFAPITPPMPAQQTAPAKVNLPAPNFNQAPANEQKEEKAGPVIVGRVNEISGGLQRYVEETNDYVSTEINTPFGVRDTLARAGKALGEEAVSEQALNISGGRLGLTALLKAAKPPTAIVCGNDLLATGALLQAQRQGLNIPADLSICGIDNHELAAEMNPGLTTVSLPAQDLGRIAASQILAALGGEPIAQQSLLPFELLVRGTTAKPGK